MLTKLKSLTAVAVLILIGLGTTTIGASAITVELARKCSALTAKTYPPREIGNPAAGSTKGTGLAEQNYFQKCVANGGNMQDE